VLLQLQNKVLSSHSILVKIEIPNLTILLSSDHLHSNEGNDRDPLDYAVIFPCCSILPGNSVHVLAACCQLWTRECGKSLLVVTLSESIDDQSFFCSCEYISLFRLYVPGHPEAKVNTHLVHTTDSCALSVSSRSPWFRTS
jgi:hypothetical protein